MSEHIIHGESASDLFDAIGELSGADDALSAAEAEPAPAQPDTPVMPDELEDIETPLSLEELNLDDEDEDEDLDDAELDEEGEEEEDLEEESELEEDEEEGEEEESEEVAENSIKAKVGDKEIEIPANAKFEVKVNGESREVELEELQRSYSGQTEIRRRFSELDHERKSFTETRQQFINEQRALEGNLELLNELDGEALIAHLSQMRGVDPAQTLNQIRQQTVELLQEMERVPPEARAAILEAKNIKLQHKVEQARQRVAQRMQGQANQHAAQEAERAELIDALDRYGFTNQEFKEAVEEIARGIEAGELEGGWEPLDVVDYIHEQKTLTTIEDAARVSLGSDPKDELVEFIQTAIELHERKLNKPLTQEQVAKKTKQIIKQKQKRTQSALSKTARVTKKANSQKVTESRKKGKKNSAKITADQLSNFMNF